jgi:hypothetical protein
MKALPRVLVRFGSSLNVHAALFILFAASFLQGCSDSGTQVQLAEVSILVEYPSTYAQLSASGASVTIRSLERGTEEVRITDASGAVSFGSMPPGSYAVSASRSLSTAEALALTGIAQNVELNAVVASQVVSPGMSPLRLTLAGSRIGSWVIKEIYYAGSARPTGGTYFHDQFYEIVNNSTDTLYAGGLMLASIHGVSGQINPSSQPTPFQSDTEHVYAEAVWRVPGGASAHPVPPGGRLVFAAQGIAHRTDPNGNPGSPVDLDRADWEMYIDVPDSRDLDNPAVPNLEMVHRRFGFFALVPVFGPAIVLVEGDFSTFEQVIIPGQSPTSPPVVKIPVAMVLDAVEALQNADSGPFKRLPASIDAGFAHVSGTYTSESIRRRVQSVIAGRTVYVDTNNSSADFEVASPPTPRLR